MWIVYKGSEEVAQFETQIEAKNHAANLNEAYRTDAYRVKYEPDY